jgi:1-acyl-sn-glycerol-3-phosphate acyltransferase
MWIWSSTATIILVLAAISVVVAVVRYWRRARARRLVDWGARWLNVLDGIVRDFCHRYHRMNGAMLRLPERGGAIVVSNHVSGLDPLLLIACSPRPLRFLIAREQYERFGLNWLFRAVGCIPVDRDSRPDRALRAALRALADGEVVALFPQGGIHTGEAPALLKGGVARLAQRSGARIFPAHIDGVRGAGHTLPAVILRSRVHVRVFEPFVCDGDDTAQCLERVSALLHKSRWTKALS